MYRRCTYWSSRPLAVRKSRRPRDLLDVCSDGKCHSTLLHLHGDSRSRWQGKLLQRNCERSNQAVACHRYTWASRKRIVSPANGTLSGRINFYRGHTQPEMGGSEYYEYFHKI